jgi:hypothetical protein
MRILNKLFPATAAAAIAASLLVAAPQAAHAQWWNMGSEYGNGLFADFGYYPNYTRYYDTDFRGDEWDDWWD